MLFCCPVKVVFFGDVSAPPVGRNASFSTFFLRLCRCCCPSCVLPSRSGKASGLRERDRGVLGYLNGSVSFESRPLRTEQSERDRMRPEEGMLLTPIMVERLEGHRTKLLMMIRIHTWTSLRSDFDQTSKWSQVNLNKPSRENQNWAWKQTKAGNRELFSPVTTPITHARCLLCQWRNKFSKHSENIQRRLLTKHFPTASVLLQGGERSARRQRRRRIPGLRDEENASAARSLALAKH